MKPQIAMPTLISASNNKINSEEIIDDLIKLKITISLQVKMLLKQ